MYKKYICFVKIYVFFIEFIVQVPIIDRKLIKFDKIIIINTYSPLIRIKQPNVR